MAKEIIFEDLSIANFMSVGLKPIKVDFKNGVTLITGENMDYPGRKNAIGKTVLFDALFFALFGEGSRKKLEKKTLVNFQTKKNCVVVLNMLVKMDDGTEKKVNIRRQLAPSKLTLTIDGKDATLDTMSNTDIEIEKILGGNATVFRNLLILTAKNDDTSFMAKNAAERREFTEGIFGLEFFQTLKKSILEDAKEQKATVATLSASLTQLRSNKEFAETNFNKKEADRNKAIALKTDYENQCKSEIEIATAYNNEIDTKKESLTRIFEAKLKEIELENSTIDARKASIVKIAEEKAAAIVAENEAKEAAFLALEKEIEAKVASIKAEITKNIVSDEEIASTKKYESFIAALDTKISDSDSRKRDFVYQISVTNQEKNALIIKITSIKEVRKQGGKCPSCGQPVEKHSPEQLDKEEQNLNTLISEKEALIVELEAKRDAEISNIGLFRSKKDEFKAIIDAFFAKVKLGESLQKEEQKLNIQLKDAESAMHKGKKNPDSILADAHKQASMLVPKTTDDLRAAYEKKMAEFVPKNILAIENAWMSKISAINVPDTDSEKQMVDHLTLQYKEKLAEMKVEARKTEIIEFSKMIISDECAKAFFIRKILGTLNEKILYFLRKLGTKIKVSFNDLLEETIIDAQGNQTSYHNLSGAEGKTVDLACMFAFYFVKVKFGRVKYDILMFDEIFDVSFDSLGLTIVMNVLKEELDKNGLKCLLITHNKDLQTTMPNNIVKVKMEKGFTELM